MIISIVIVHSHRHLQLVFSFDVRIIYAISTAFYIALNLKFSLHSLMKPQSGESWELKLLVTQDANSFTYQLRWVS